MRYSATSARPDRVKAGCLVAGVYESGALGVVAADIDKATNGSIKRVLKSGDLDGSLGQTLLVRDPDGVTAQRLLLVGLGKKGKLDADALRQASKAAAAALLKTGSGDAVLALGRDYDDEAKAARIVVQAIEFQLYRFDQLKSKPGKAPKLKAVTLSAGSRSAANACKDEARIASGMATGATLARDLANLPANHCTPTHLAKTARELGRRFKTITTQVLNEAQIRKLKMGAFLSVTAGAAEPACFIIMKYQGAPRATGDAKRPIVLVGKGITFDSGGISIKPAPAMDEMKYDMGGAASVLGTFAALAELKPAINVVGLIPTCENMPSGTATRPGDVVTSLSGKTIEILNTDAEGRLILCDALTYAKRFKPRTTIDIATLTGACVVALGDHLSGLMTENDDLASELLAAGARAGDEAWRLPVSKHYSESLKSNFADLANVGSRYGGASIAAAFLSEFTEGQRWAHLDVAGTAWKGGNEKGATGRPVALLTQYLLDQAGDKA